MNWPTYRAPPRSGSRQEPALTEHTRPDGLLHLQVSRSAVVVVITVAALCGLLTITPSAPWPTHPDRAGSGTCTGPCTGPFRAMCAWPER
jgi:hypothetical protein